MKVEWQAARQVIETIEQAGFEAVIVGGAVRDYYLGKPGNDVDVATSALPQEVKALFEQTIDVGIEHGTVLVLDTGEPVEVTTYRTESTYSDHRRPDEVKFVRTLVDDLLRRDFTMNAMAINNDDEIIDYYEGRKDIDAKIIRAVGEPLARFQEDALRMLRAVRFSAQLGFSIEPHTLQAIHKHAASIQYVAVERMQVEISKVWTGQYVAQGIETLQQSGLANFLQGEFNPQQWQAFQTDNRLVGWAYFCLVNEDFDATLLSAYRCSNKDKVFVKQVLQAYRALLNSWQPMHYLLYELQVLHIAYQFASWQNKHVTISVDDIALNKQALPLQHSSELAVSGYDLMQWTTKKRGPWVKAALQAAVQAVLEGRIENKPEQIKEWFIDEYDNEG